MRAVGIHVFAGGFSYGVNKVFDVQCQLEKHGFALETAEQTFGIRTINGDWPEIEAEFAYGNPRCTGFSSLTGGYDDSVHGPWAKQCQDVHDLCEYSVGKYDVIIWESVQQAYTTGRPLLDYLRDEVFAPQHYRIAHLFINASSFGNTQSRRRYFFVAYRDDRNFNVSPPSISRYQPVLYDDLWDLRERETREVTAWEDGYDFDTYTRLGPNEKACVPYLPNGWGLNHFAQFASHKMPPVMRDKWRFRTSDMPFSLHCIKRVQWLRPSPTLYSSCSRLIHPDLDRPITVGEAATIMGWEGRVPVGPVPFAQIAKGVVPQVGTWLAEQAKAYLENAWGDEDWESSYDANLGEWVGSDVHGAREKVIDMTRYAGNLFDIERFDVAARRMSHVMEVNREGLRQL